MTKYFFIFKEPRFSNSTSAATENLVPTEDNLTDEQNAPKLSGNATNTVNQEKSVDDLEHTIDNDELDVPNIITTAPSTTNVEIENDLYNKVHFIFADFDLKNKCPWVEESTTEKVRHLIAYVFELIAT